MFPWAIVLAAWAPHAEFSNVSGGAFAAFELGTRGVGVLAIGELGVSSTGLRTFADQRGLLQWDAELAGRGGILVKTYPPLLLVGVTTAARLEAGWRVQGRRPWSAYLGLRGAAKLQALASPEVRWSELALLGNLEGVGGIDADAALGLAAGASWISGEHSVLLSAFGQTALQFPAEEATWRGVNGGGVSVRWDISRKLILFLEGFWGVSPRSGVAALGLTRQITRQDISLGFRYLFPDAIWIGARAEAGGEQTRTQYSMGGTYLSAEPLLLTLLFHFGVPL